MSQRMTDTSWGHYKQDAEWSRNDRINITAELDRARSEEARLLEENRKQAEVAKTLADALHGALKDIRGRMGHRLLTPDGEWCACDDCDRRLAALRLAGRLK